MMNVYIYGLYVVYETVDTSFYNSSSNNSVGTVGDFDVSGHSTGNRRPVVNSNYIMQSAKYTKKKFN